MPANKDLTLFAGRGDFLHNGIVSADFNWLNFIAAVSVKAYCTKVVRQLDVAGEVLFDKRHVVAVHDSVRIDVGFVEVDTIYRIRISIYVLLHHVDIRHIHCSVVVGIAVQDIILGKRRQCTQRKCGQQDAKG